MTVSPAGGVATVMVVGVDSRGMGMLRECLGADALLPPVSAPYGEALIELRRTRPTVIVTGFDENFDEAVRLGPLLSAESPYAQLVAYSTRSDPDRIRAAMRAGYREYVVLPEDAAQLRRALHEATETAAFAEDRGEIIAVCGAKGGVGSTSIAINVAAELCPVYRVVVADLDFSMGDVSSFLDLQPPSHIHNVIHSLDRLDERLLTGSVAVHPSKVHILAQPREVETEEVKGEAILRLLTVCARAYQYVILDCGCRLDEATLTATTAADQVFLVCTPTVPSVKNAWRRLHLFERLGMDKGRIRLIVNKIDRRAGLKPRDIETNLGLKIAGTIVSDDKTMLSAVNQGRLARDVNKRAPIARDFSSLVSLITDEEDDIVDVKPARGRGAFARLFSKG